MAGRITMADVAREGKVHQTTVSLALRNDPRLPEATRRRIRTLAERMGYRPDPMLSALNIYRSSRAGARAKPSMAFVMRSRNRRWGSKFYSDDQLLKGARRACDRLGYRLVVFTAGTGAAEGTLLSRILRTRGIGGVILASLDISLQRLDLEWSHFSALCIESQHLGLSLHTVANNQMAVTRTAVRRMRERGYRRIGLCVGRVEEMSLRKPFTAGYLLEAREHADLVAVPPLLMEPTHDETLAVSLRSWLEAHQPDAVLSNWSSMPEMLRTAGWRVPDDIGVATLDHNPGRGPVAGIRQSHQLVGERAVEALALMMKTNQTGLIELPNVTLVDGLWQDGPELPPRARGSAGKAVSRSPSTRA